MLKDTEPSLPGKSIFKLIIRVIVDSLQRQPMDRRTGVIGINFSHFALHISLQTVPEIHKECIVNSALQRRDFKVLF